MKPTGEDGKPPAATDRLRALRPVWLGQVTPETIRADLFAGLTGATIVLPQAVAFAAIAGLPPEYGFYTAIVTPVIAALAGSSWHAVSGPTTAISILVFTALADFHAPGSPSFIAAAITLALLVGLIQIGFGLARLGGLVDFVSHSVMTGFVAGAALLIGISQFRHALGVDLPRPENLPEHLATLGAKISEANASAVAIAALAFVTGWGVKRFLPGWPNYLAALLAGTLLYLALGEAAGEVKTIGEIHAVVPGFALPEISAGAIRDLGASAFAIAIVGLLEAMSVSRALAIRSGQSIDSNREFIGQGMSNAVGSLFRCYPGSASFTRSGVNFDAGARTPLSAIFAALFLLLILVFVADRFALVPVPAMAGVILLVAWKLIDFREIRHIVTTSGAETWIAVITFVSALVINLEFAIYAGVFLSLALFLNATARPFIGVGAPDPSTPARNFRNAAMFDLKECPQLVIARIDGAFYFGSVEFVRRAFRRFEVERPDQKHLLFIVMGVGEIDMPAADLLIEEAVRRERRGGSFHLKTRTPRTLTRLARFRVMRELGRERIHLSKGEAIASIVPMLDPSICAGCTARIFRECRGRGEPEAGAGQG